MVEYPLAFVHFEVLASDIVERVMYDGFVQRSYIDFSSRVFGFRIFSALM